VRSFLRKAATYRASKLQKYIQLKELQWEVSFISEIKGFGKFPSGRNVRSCVITQYPHGVVDASYQAMMMTTTAKEGEQFIWCAHEKSRLEDDRKIKGRVIVSCLVSQNLKNCHG
jgi:hypothetical protein